MISHNEKVRTMRDTIVGLVKLAGGTLELSKIREHLQIEPLIYDAVLEEALKTERLKPNRRFKLLGRGLMSGPHIHSYSLTK